MKTIKNIPCFFRQKRVFQILFWLWLCFILMNSLLPKQVSSGITTNDTSFIRMDYIMHFMGYFLLALLFYLWKFKPPFHINRTTFWIFIYSTTGLAIGSEVAQKFIPGRGYNEVDFIANILGISLGIILPWLYFKKRTTEGRNTPKKRFE